MNKPVSFAALAAVATSTLVATAQEQPWLQDRRYGEGIGIRTGDLELHPGIAAETGYDSNYFQRSGDPNEEVISTIRLRVTPSFSVATLGPQRRENDGNGSLPPKVDFRATASGSYNEFIATNSDYRKQASRQRHFAGQIGFLLDVLPTRPWGADLIADFQRQVDPSNNPNGAIAFDRDTIRFGAGVKWRPGGGLFDWRLGYEFRFNYFEEQAFQSLNNSHHYLKTKGRWRFLPRSAVVYDAELGFISYVNGGNAVLNDSQPIRTRLGFNGLITNHFALLAMAGWGASFYSNAQSPTQDYDSLIAHGEFKWFILPQPRLPEDSAKVGLSSVAVGYNRDFTDSYLTDYYQRDRGYMNFSYFFAGAFVLAVEGGVSHITYPPSYFEDNSLRKVGFSETRIDAEIFGEYRFSDTVGLNSTLRYNTAIDKADDGDVTNGTDNVILVSQDGGLDNLAFSRFEAYLGVRWFM